MKTSTKIAFLQLPLMILASSVTGVFYRGIRTSADTLNDIVSWDTFQGGLWWVTILSWLAILILGIAQIWYSLPERENSRTVKIAGIFAVLTIIPLGGAAATIVAFVYNVIIIRRDENAFAK